MKLFKYGLPLAAVAMLASCSNDNIDQPVNGGVQDIPEDGYNASFVVALPAVKDTRAVDFEDGDATEYAVKNAVIYVYKGDNFGNEDDYELVTASQIFYTPAQGAGSNDVSQKVTINVRLTDVDKSGDTEYYGLCIVNLDDSNNGKPGNGFITPDDSSLADKKFKTWRTTVMGSAQHDQNPFIADINGTTYYTMTNAPTFEGDVFGQDAWNPYTTLVKLNPENFVESPAKPSAPAGVFFVQRGVAKVVLKGSLSSITSAQNDDDAFQVTNWNIDVLNNFTFPVQNVEKVADEMASASFYKDDVSYFYTTKGNNVNFSHIWWANDPNYTTYKSSLEDDFYSMYKDQQSPTANLVWKNAGTDNYEDKVAYCLENTMPFNKMIQNQTTRVLVKGVYKVALPENTVETNDFSFVVNPNTDEAYRIPKAMLAVNESKTNVQFKTLFDTTKSGWEDTMETIADAIHMNPQGLDNVDFYLDGITHYVARIHHFHPEDETPLGLDSFGQPVVIETVNDYNEGHTGRYSVLRNNVYNVTVQKVLGYGSPTIPEPGDTPDDDPDSKKYNLQVDINVLKWAARDYGYDLK